MIFQNDILYMTYDLIKKERSRSAYLLYKHITTLQRLSIDIKKLNLIFFLPDANKYQSGLFTNTGLSHD